MYFRNSVKRVSCVFVAAFVFSACGGSTKKSGEQATTTSTTIGTLATTIPLSTRVSPDISIPPAPGSENSTFCVAMRGGLGGEVSTAIEPGITSDQLRAAIAKTLADLKSQESNVPDDMANEFGFVNAYYQRIDAALRLTNYDIDKLVTSDTLFNQITPTKMESDALIRFLSYQREVCDAKTLPAITAP